MRRHADHEPSPLRDGRSRLRLERHRDAPHRFLQIRRNPDEAFAVVEIEREFEDRIVNPASTPRPARQARLLP